MSSPYLLRRLGAHLPSKVVSAAAARAARMWDWVATATACGVASRAGLRGGRRSGSRMGSRRPCATPGDGIRWRPGVLWPPKVQQKLWRAAPQRAVPRWPEPRWGRVAAVRGGRGERRRALRGLGLPRAGRRRPRRMALAAISGRAPALSLGSPDKAATRRLAVRHPHRPSRCTNKCHNWGATHRRRYFRAGFSLLRSRSGPRYQDPTPSHRPMHQAAPPPWRPAPRLRRWPSAEAGCGQSPPLLPRHWAAPASGLRCPRPVGPARAVRTRLPRMSLCAAAASPCVAPSGSDSRGRI
ncbi:unnamed protein product [Urochloa humidicola]